MDCVMAAEWEGGASADSNRFVPRATTATAAHCTTIHLILLAIFDTTLPQTTWLTIEEYNRFRRREIQILPLRPDA